ncbi:hypothetical protein D9T17_11530 [Lysobacter enzymogenes]|uniref:Uncharacterized protein n=1 Tax=Lysobacter enzymogenes TaxID=69 RepID=A0A3N2RHW3_LYSEN|nr:hypothetical protein D9T17_11530 [Lysobacter enzymogenes]
MGPTVAAGLSSPRMTCWVKQPFPGLALAVLGAMLVGGVFSRPWHPLSLLMAVGVVVLAAAIQRAMARHLADEVVDGGDHLLVRSDGIEEKVMLRDVATIRRGFGHNPERLILTLRRPGRLGDTIAFIPKGIRWFPYVEHPLAYELRTRAQLLRLQP